MPLAGDADQYGRVPRRLLKRATWFAYPISSFDLHLRERELRRCVLACTRMMRPQSTAPDSLVAVNSAQLIIVIIMLL